jgi:hypothetical protein
MNSSGTILVASTISRSQTNHHAKPGTAIAFIRFLIAAILLSGGLYWLLSHLS